MSARISQAQRVLLREGVAQLELDLSDEVMQKLEAHLALVNRWRGNINLISIKNEVDLISHHALDSLVIAPLLTQSRNVLDIGSGAGFPGMQLACVYPEIDFTLLDSRQRRVEFLRMVVTALKLQNVSLSTSRVESYQQSPSQAKAAATIKFDTLVARAVSSLAQLVSLTQHLRFPGQRLVAMKGVYPKAEIEALEQQFGAFIRDISVKPLAVPFLDAERHAVIIHF